MIPSDRKTISHSHYHSHIHLPNGTVMMNSAGELPGFDNVTVSDTEPSTIKIERKVEIL